MLPTAAAFHDKNSHSESALHPRLGGETENIHFFLQVHFSLGSFIFSLFVALQLCSKDLDIENLEVSLK